jgi:hypothetical protein
LDGLALRALLLWARFRHWLVEPARALDLAPQSDRAPELDSDHGPCLRALACLEHHAQDAVDAEPEMPEAGVVHTSGLSLAEAELSTKFFDRLWFPWLVDTSSL